ncbi:50S ribosomal protein L15 [soil metagenome]
MNILSNLTQTVDKRKKRLGRGTGSGAGAKSGRGTTRHQKARTDIPLHFEGGQNRMVKRFPQLRGKNRNKSIQTKPTLVTIANLEELKTGSVVNLETLVINNIITEKKSRQGAKVVGTGNLTKSLTVELPVSQTAKDIIEKAGGTVT